MRGNILIKAVFWGISLATVLSCSSKKAAVSADAINTEVSRAERSRILRQVELHQRAVTTFSGRAKSEVAFNQDHYEVTANVRIERDKAIWISVTALMGIEAGRILITPDSVKLINRLQAAYVSKPFEYLHNFTNNELDFFSLQQLLVGHVVQQTLTNDSEIWMNDRGYFLRGQRNDLQYSVQLDTSYRPASAVFTDTIRNQRMEAHYKEYQSSEGQTFPNQVKISIVAAGLTLQSEMHYNRMVYDEKLEMPFSIPARYKEIQ